MRATLEKVSRYGVMVDGDWKNLSKFHKGVNLAGFNAGDEVEIELQKDKFITSLSHVNGENNEQNLSENTTNTQSNTTRTKEGTPQRQATITRLSVISSVFSSPLMATHLNDADLSEALATAIDVVQDLTHYAETGERRSQD